MNIIFTFTLTFSLIYYFRVVVDGSIETLISSSAGSFQGSVNSAGVRVWQSIRYAQAPVGNLRFSSPQSPTTTYSGVVDTTSSGPGCPQYCNLPAGNCPKSTSEDCLFLTVTSPAYSSSDSNGYPVFFWIHGGSYVSGSGNSALYNATNFALNNVVTVSINYRLGVLGFLASNSMSGNYGLEDQQLALAWTKTNIAAFGGNPSKITIGGESAGGMSVACHLVSPKSQGYFSNAIMESNPVGIPFQTRDSAASIAKTIMRYLSCSTDDISCMRYKSVNDILNAQSYAVAPSISKFFFTTLPFTPVVDEDNGILPYQPFDAILSGRINSGISLLSGFNKDEGQLFVYQTFAYSLSSYYYQIAVSTIFKNYANQILSMYPFDLIPNNEDGRTVLSVMCTDAIFYCPLRAMAKSTQNSNPTFLYKFQHVLSFNPWGSRYYCYNASCHGAELPFVFNIFRDDASRINFNPTSSERDLSSAMNDAWSNFMKYGNPNTGESGSLSFPRYSSSSDQVSILDVQGYATVVSSSRSSYCDMWDSIGYDSLWGVSSFGSKKKPAGGPKDSLTPTSIVLIAVLGVILPVIAGLCYIFRNRIKSFANGTPTTTSASASDPDYYRNLVDCDAEAKSPPGTVQAFAYPVVIIPDKKNSR